MAMKIVEIVSRETIKPSSPTPVNLMNFKLSLLDQLAPKVYVPLLLFYRPCGADTTDADDDRLKKSLAEILAHMYPLAGRIKDMFSIECNDQGAEFVQANVHHDLNMSTLIQNPKLHLLQQLLPCDYPFALTTSEQALLAVQINRFACGGTVLGICVGHIVADGASVGTFVKNWAAIARGGENNIVTSNFFVDYITLFPPRDFNFIKKNHHQEEQDPNKGTKAYRFVFSGSNISAFKQKAEAAAKESPEMHPPTRVEAVSVILWLALNSAIRGRKKISYLTHMVNLRSRINPQMPPHSLGNICQAVGHVWDETTTTVTITPAAAVATEEMSLLKRLQDWRRNFNGETIMKQHKSGEYFSLYKKGMEESGNYQDVVGFLNISSWCRFPVYEADFGFGWGKPIWACSPVLNVNAGTFMDTSDGLGIEAWVRLQEEDMNNFLQNLHFLSYVSSSQPIYN